jgi:hypothetical protein
MFVPFPLLFREVLDKRSQTSFNTKVADAFSGNPATAVLSKMTIAHDKGKPAAR